MKATLGIFFVVLLGPIPNHAAPKYKVIDLGSLGGPRFYESFSGVIGKLINNNGLAAAGMETSETDPSCANDGCQASHGFLWNNGTLSDLGLLAPGQQANFSQSFSINEQNNCVGISTFNTVSDTGTMLYRAVLWKYQPDAVPQIIDLGTLGGNQSLAHAINNRNQVVGWALNSTPEDAMIWDDYPWPFGTQQRAVLWEKGTIQDLGTLGGPSAWASHINDRGQIVGSSYTSAAGNGRRSVGIWSWSRPAGAFLWQDGKMTDLGTLGGTFGMATRINNQSQIIGVMSTRSDSAVHPFLWANGVLTDLGGRSGEPHDINELGEVVGLAVTSSGAYHPFLWRNGVIKDLGTLGSNSGQAWAINAKSQVVGTSGPSLSQDRAFLWEDNGGPMRDLNSLVPQGSPILAQGFNINDRGEILAGGLDQKGLYLLVPLPTLAIRTDEVPLGRKIVVEAQTIPGRSYRLESSFDLKNWTTAGPNVVADETTAWEFATSSLRLFYRVTGSL
jgi:probable HAF family extracellular repeat protein